MSTRAAAKSGRQSAGAGSGAASAWTPPTPGISGKMSRCNATKTPKTRRSSPSARATTARPMERVAAQDRLKAPTARRSAAPERPRETPASIKGHNIPAPALEPDASSQKAHSGGSKAKMTPKTTRIAFTKARSVRLPIRDARGPASSAAGT